MKPNVIFDVVLEGPKPSSVIELFINDRRLLSSEYELTEGGQVKILADAETNRADPCPKGGKHSWIGDEAGDSWCEKCGEPLED
jgi:hypothetical protein